MKREPVFAMREKEEEDLLEELLAEWDVPVEVRKAWRAAGLADGIVEGKR